MKDNFSLLFSLLVVSLAHAEPVPVTPQIFAPGIISGPANDGAPAFTPDGNTLFFTRSGVTSAVILESTRAGGHWSEPRIAPFSGQWNDMQPALSPDGSFIVFVSSRNGKNGETRLSGLWRANRSGEGWSEPVRLPDTVNISSRVFKPTVAGDGSIYFMAMLTPAQKGKKFRLFRSQFANGAYQQAQALPFSDGTTGDVDPEIGPNESFLLFSSDGRRPDDAAHEHLYIVFKKDGKWGTVMPIRYGGDDANGGGNDNESHLSPDHKTLYFSSDRSMAVHFPRTMAQAKQDLERIQTWDNGNYNVWFMPLESWL